MNKWLAFTIVLVLCFIALFMIVVIPRSGSRSQLKGVIFVSSSATASKPYLETYAVNVADGSRTVIGETSESVGDFYTFSRDASAIAFIGTTRPILAAAQGYILDPSLVWQVYYASKTSAHTIPLPDTAQRVSSSSALYKFDPAVSDDGSYVAYVTATTAPSLTSIASTVHTINLAVGTDVPLFAGVAPQWYSSSSFFYVSPDGIRLYDTSASSSYLVLAIHGQDNFKLSISPDRHILAFSDPDARRVFVYAIKEDGRQLRPVRSLDMLAYWIVFAPDSRYFAIQTTTQPSQSPSLVIFDSSSFTQVGSIDLSPLLNDRLFVTSWQY